MPRGDRESVKLTLLDVAPDRQFQDDDQTVAPNRAQVKQQLGHYITAEYLQNLKLSVAYRSASQSDACKRSYSTWISLLTRRGSAVRGFDGSPGPTLGTVVGKSSIETGESMTMEFLVSPDITPPIVGIGALARMGMIIDCASRQHINNRTANILLCAVVIGEKPEEIGRQDV